MGIRAILLSLIAAAAAVTADASSLQILYPLYSYPNRYSPGTYTWGYVAAATAPITAIINPDNGPTGPPNADYLHGMGDLQRAGVTMVGRTARAVAKRLNHVENIHLDIRKPSSY